jgi:hypothetical protein
MSAPLTEQEQIDLRRLMGWSDRFNSTDEAFIRAVYAVNNRDATLDTIRVLLARCLDQETQIIAAQRRLKAASVGSIDTNPIEIDKLRDVGRQWTGQIARIMGVECRGDAWSGSLPTDRAWYDGPQGGGGLIPFG